MYNVLSKTVLFDGKLKITNLFSFLNQVLQGWFSKELFLYGKDKKSPVATLTIATLSRFVFNCFY